jgi:heme exporter protein CcmD
MSATDSILAAYLITALLVGGLCAASWIRAKRVKRALAAQESAAGR